MEERLANAEKEIEVLKARNYKHHGNGCGVCPVSVSMKLNDKKEVEYSVDKR